MTAIKSRISIVLPVYNAKNTIKKCLEGIENQTISDWKLLVVDDGSTDETGIILDTYAERDSRIIIYHRENQGVSESRNYAISMIDTPYFVCVDSDDYIFPDYLEILLEAKRKFPDYYNIWSGFQTVESQKQIKGKKHLLSSNAKYSFKERDDILFLYNAWMVQMPWHKLYDTKIVQQNALKMDEKLSLGEDFIFNLEYMDMIENKKVLIINKVTYNYVISDKDSLDHKYRKDLLNIYIQNDKTFAKYLTKWEIEDWDIFINSCFYHYVNAMRNTFHKENKEFFINKIKYNNKILKSEDFKEIYSNRTCYLNKYYDRAYRSGNYIFVRILDYIVKIRKGK